MVSHDHRFLDNVSTYIADVDYETILLYRGNYTDFMAAKVAERERKEAEIAKQEKQIADHKEFVDRFRAKATKARQAQSKLKMIDRIEIVRLPRSSRRYPIFKFAQVRPSGKEVLKAEDIAKSYGDDQVLDGVDLQVRRGDRLAILGPNGIGKSTLLKIADGRGRGRSRQGRVGLRDPPRLLRAGPPRAAGRAARRRSRSGCGTSVRASRSASCAVSSAWCSSPATR